MITLDDITGLTKRQIMARAGYRQRQLSPKRTVWLWASRYSEGTYRPGRNAEKRAARTDAARLRRLDVKLYAGVKCCPKIKYSGPFMDMLANRRLRQTRGEGWPT